MMSRSIFSCFLLTSLGFVGGVDGVRAGEPAAQLQKIVLPGENKDSLAELLVADRLVDPKHSPQALGSIIGLGSAPGPLGPIPALALERINQQQWAEAMEEYQRLIDEEGDNLVPSGPRNGPTRGSVQLRRLCHLRMAAAPPSALVQHQKRVSALAEKLYRDGKEKHARQPLRRLVNDLFCSRPAGPALELLGDLAFEQGNFAMALSWWRLLAWPATAEAKDRSLLRIPGDPADPARIKAKQIMALAFLGAHPQAQAELKAFQLEHPKRQGKLAGREGNYAAIVAEVIRNLPRDKNMDEPWTTFAGSPTRNRVSDSISDRWWADGPTWRVSLLSEKDVLPRAGLKQTVPYHPVIVDDKVLIADDRTVKGYHLLTGDKLFHYHPFGADAGPWVRRAMEAFTLTVSRSRIYARFSEPKGKGDKSYLVCLEMVPIANDKDKVRVTERWRIQAKDSVFEGAPLVHDGLAYTAQSRSADKRTHTSLACYDAVSGKSRWLQELCETPDQGGRHDHLLTLADSQIIFCSHSGAIVAVDAGTGKPKWGVRYLSRGPNTKDGLPSPRSLCPPLAADGRLFLAPADSDRIFCLDTLTGQILWDRGGIEVVHLLAVARGRLIFTTPQGLQAIMADSGLDQGGWLKPDVGTLPPLGRGLLAGDWVFWPTRDRKFPLRAVTQDQGEQEDRDPNRLRLLRPGNMVLGNGCLVVAGPDELVGYVSPRRLLQKRQTETGQPTASAQVLYLLAQAQAEVGLDDLALAHFARVANSPDPGQWQGRPLQTLALERRHELLLHLARRAEQTASKPDWPRAAGYLRQAIGPEFPKALRLQAHIRLAELWARAGQAAKAVAAWQTLLQDQDCRNCVFFPTKTPPQAVASLAEKRIQDLIDKNGVAVYADWEEQARDAQRLANGNTSELEKVVRRYPNATLIPEILWKLADLQEKAGRFGAAAQSYRRLLQKIGADPVPALIGLAHAYEKQQCYSAAKVVWLQLAKNHGEKRFRGRLVRDLAADQLRKTEDQDARIKRQITSWPLGLAWTCPAGSLLVPERTSLAANPQAVFLARANRLSAHEIPGGKERWSRKLSFTPSWIGLHADFLVAAGQKGIAALRLEDGQAVWTFDPDTPEHTFSGFHLSTSGLFFRDGKRQLLVVELETGRIAWSQWAPGALFQSLGGGRFFPYFHAGEDFVMVQTGTGRRLVFHVPTGKQIQESRSSEQWLQDPLPVDARRMCLVEKGRIIVLDTTTWKDHWTFTPPWPTSYTGEPLQVAKDGKSLFVLIPRNYGCELERLDPRTGKSLWPQPPLLARAPVDIATMSFDDDCFYCVADGELTCRSLADGKRKWHKSLSGITRRWQTVVNGETIIAYPTEDRQPPWLWLPLGNLTLALPSRHDIRSRPLAVSCHHRHDGRQLQRLDFSAPTTRLQIQLFPNQLVMGGAQGIWGFTPSQKRKGFGLD
jgi:outer membrane protein assembly factor BamB/tetratricopeptide (TPR) repeat protein